MCVKNILKMWPLEFQCGFLKMPPGSHSGFLKLTSSAHRAYPASCMTPTIVNKNMSHIINTSPNGGIDYVFYSFCLED